MSIQLQFEKGEVITVTRIVDGGWWEGVCDGRSGWFPGNYVERATGKMCMRCIYYYVHGVCGCGGVCVCWYGGGHTCVCTCMCILSTCMLFILCVHVRMHVPTFWYVYSLVIGGVSIFIHVCTCS